MPEQIRCPSCNSALRVPESLLGKNVKCPKCATSFVAEMEAPAQPEGIVRERTPKAARSRKPEEDFLEEVPDEEPPEEEEDEDLPRPRRRRRGRGRRSAVAESAVAGPAIAMMVAAGLDIAYDVLNLLLTLVMGAGMMASGGGLGGPRTSDTAVQLVAGTGASVVRIGVMAFVVVCAVKMKSLSSYGLAMTGCILSMLPCHCCCFLGLPFGIWGLVVLNQPEVKDAFS